MIPSYFLKFLNTPKDELSTFNMVQICSQNIPDDVFNRIDGLEDFDDDTINGSRSEIKIFRPDSLKEIINDEHDDTNETTKYRIELLYNKVKKFDYFMITPS